MDCNGKNQRHNAFHIKNIPNWRYESAFHVLSFRSTPHKMQAQGTYYEPNEGSYNFSAPRIASTSFSSFLKGPRRKPLVKTSLLAQRAPKSPLLRRATKKWPQLIERSERQSGTWKTLVNLLESATLVRQPLGGHGKIPKIEGKFFALLAPKGKFHLHKTTVSRECR